MKYTIFASLVLALAAGSVVQAAQEWGIEGEEKTRADVTVVDLLCEVTGDCTENCGNGKRQLGILFDDGRLLPVVKNRDIFAGGTDDLIGFCGKKITADGLIINDDRMPLFAIQFKRLAPDGKWSGATQWGKNWGERNPGKPAKAWYKHDPLVLETLEADGVFGIPGLKPEE